MHRRLSLVGVPFTFLLVLVTWVFFRAVSFTDAWHILTAMADGSSVGSDTALHIRKYQAAIVAFSAIIAFSEPMIVAMAERHGIAWWWRVPFWLRGTAYASLALICIMFGGLTQRFIYFDF